MGPVGMSKVQRYNLEQKHHYCQTQQIDYHCIHKAVVIWFRDRPIGQLETTDRLLIECDIDSLIQIIVCGEDL